MWGRTHCRTACRDYVEEILNVAGMDDAALRQRIATDGHTPGNYCALTVRNIDAWYDTFDVQPGDDLYLAPDMRVRIW